MEVHFRKAIKEDFARINELFQEMLRAIYGNEDVKGYGDGDLDYYFAGKEDWICVAEVGGRIEGFLSMEVHREAENYLYYDDLSVSKAHRGKGIGTALLDKGEAYCKTLGLSTLVLHVETDNERARELYEKRGFTLLKTDGTRLCLVKRLPGGPS
ncbi:MAG: GNAT family N-acetyltransferase [Clostridia bacterium]|nr:GNAT family N-acetyltransferase [Clostridia bacterium]